MNQAQYSGQEVPPRGSFNRPRYMTLLIDVTKVVQDEIVRYHTIDGQDDTKFNYWLMSSLGPTWYQLNKMQQGRQYAVKIKVDNHRHDLVSIREVSVGQQL